MYEVLRQLSCSDVFVNSRSGRQYFFLLLREAILYNNLFFAFIVMSDLRLRNSDVG